MDPPDVPAATIDILRKPAVDKFRFKFASQLAVLRSCLAMISRLFNNKSSMLLAAKVLVISRLLHAKLSQSPNPPPYLDNLRDRIGNLRRRLLSKIDRRFRHVDLTQDVLVETMSAFSLATSSSTRDVIRHFHHQRHEAVCERMADVDADHESVLVAIRLYVKSLRETQALVPNQLAHALERLKSSSLIKSLDVNAVTDLKLDIHERWIDDDVKTFTPYIRHDDLSKTESETSLKLWADSVFSSLLDGLRARLGMIQQSFVLTELRKQVLELWLTNSQYSLGINPAEALDRLRAAFNLQYIRIVQDRATKLSLISTIAEEELQAWQPGVSDSSPSLWEMSTTTSELSHGSKAFRDQLTMRSLGINEPLSRLYRSYEVFRENIMQLEGMIEELRKSNWADDIDDLEDEDDLLYNKQSLLSKEDPDLLQGELQDSLQEQYAGLEKRLSKLMPGEDDKQRGQKCCFLLRAWREIRQHPPSIYQTTGLGLYSLRELHKAVAEEAISLPLQNCSHGLRRVAGRGVLQARPLWEDDPQLPILPSPWTYRLLLNLAASMTAYGRDVWSAQATNVLKSRLTRGTLPLIKALLDDHPPKTNGLVNGHLDGPNGEGSMETSPKANVGEEADRPNGTDVHNALPNGSPQDAHTEKQFDDLKIQTAFDINYLCAAMARSTSEAADNELLDLESKVIADLTLEAKSFETIRMTAAEYWKKTSLLFGLLA